MIRAPKVLESIRGVGETVLLSDSLGSWFAGALLSLVSVRTNQERVTAMIHKTSVQCRGASVQGDR